MSPISCPGHPWPAHCPRRSSCITEGVPRKRKQMGRPGRAGLLAAGEDALVPAWQARGSSAVAFNVFLELSARCWRRCEAIKLSSRSWLQVAGFLTCTTPTGRSGRGRERSGGEGNPADFNRASILQDEWRIQDRLGWPRPLLTTTFAGPKRQLFRPRGFHAASSAVRNQPYHAVQHGELSAATRSLLCC